MSGFNNLKLYYIKLIQSFKNTADSILRLSYRCTKYRIIVI